MSDDNMRHGTSREQQGIRLKNDNVDKCLLFVDSLCTDAYKDNDEKENDQSRYNANDDYFPLFAHQPSDIQIFTSGTHVSTLTSVWWSKKINVGENVQMTK